MSKASIKRGATIQKFGKYWLCDRIGAGGMAEIFVARHQGFSGFDRTLAIKRILPFVSQNPDFKEMFINEARIAARLQHANIAHIYDFGFVDGAYFLAMEYIHGKNLMAILKELQRLGVSFTLQNSAFVAMKLCDALAHAHKTSEGGVSLNIVHRDISPQNIIISYDGNVKVVDFGIASAASKITKPLVNSGSIKGKFSYMSPEQAEGLPVDSRSDIFSAGIVLYEMLTGRPLFTGNTNLDTINQVKRARVPRLSDLGVEVPDQLANIVYRALQKDAALRYQTAEEMGKDISRFLYANNPDYTSAKLAEFVSELFREDLEAEREFLDSLPKEVEKAIEESQRNASFDSPLQLHTIGSAKRKSRQVFDATNKERGGGLFQKIQLIVLILLLILAVTQALYYFYVIKPDIEQMKAHRRSQPKASVRKPDPEKSIFKQVEQTGEEGDGRVKSPPIP
ncbi:MAG: hypothetical protein Kow0090_06060 [Myxococcota bacterium]